MRFKEFVYNDNKISDVNRILEILEDNDLHWLIDSEIEDASVEIKNKTLIWNSGNYFSGNWNYGIFKNGNFYGTFVNGIIEGGVFKGKFISGVKTE